MNNQTMPGMTVEETAKFMQDHPTREEVNKYMNNLFLAINNSIGVFQGYTSHALAITMSEYLAKAGVEVSVEDFLRTLTEHNMKVVKDAQESMKQAEAMAAGNDAAAEVLDTKEVDISVL